MYTQIPLLRSWLILLNVTVSIFMLTLDASIVNIVLPTIAREFSVK